MVGNGGAVLLVLSVRVVREDEEDARLVVEEECRMRLERRFFALGLSFSVSLVARDDVEMIDKRFARSRMRPPSSTASLPLLNSFSLSPSPKDEMEVLLVVSLETVEGGDGSGASES
jgi:hypothetical protein